MSDPGAHRGSERWKEAMDLAEAALRLLPASGASPAALALITQAAARVPVAAAGGDPAPLTAALLALETAVLLAQRLGGVPDGKTAALVSRIDRLRGALAPKVPAPPSPKPGAEAVILEQRVEPEPAPARKPAAAPAAAPAMPDRLLIDGSNFLGRAPGYALGDEASRDRLMFRLQEYVRKHPAHKVTAFFDGQKTSTRLLGGIEERVTSGLHEADDVIVDFVRGVPAAERKRCTVITDDRTLAGRVRNEGVRVESVAWLSARLVAPVTSQPVQKTGLSRDELSEWEDFFKKPPQRPGR